MPLYLDLHKIQNKAKEAYSLNPEGGPVKDHSGCRCLSSWLDLQNDHLVSILDAPGEDALKKQLDEKSGSGSHEILPVDSKVAEVFLERIQQDKINSEKLKVRFKSLRNDNAVRVLLAINTADPYLLRYQIGEKDFSVFADKYRNTVQELPVQLQGKKIHHQNNYCVASFLSVYNALYCALKIRQRLRAYSNAAKIELNLIPDNASKIPDPHSELHFYKRSGSGIVVASQIREMCGASIKNFNKTEPDICWLTSSEEKLLGLLLQVLNQNRQKPNFNCRKFCRKISMSKSSLYRRCTAVTGRSPNVLIKEYRLLQALRLLRSGESITKTCYDTGFNSPSYFCYCFQKHYHIQPGFYKSLCAA